MNGFGEKLFSSATLTSNKYRHISEGSFLSPANCDFDCLATANNAFESIALRSVWPSQ
ncbi:MAG TPA: hypothetical protein VHP36_05790 [Chitinispirillaceae bacterium]|nr:hypothetical protein [Chitinispirillaceae bacterium]